MASPDRAHFAAHVGAALQGDLETRFESPHGIDQQLNFKGFKIQDFLNACFSVYFLKFCDFATIFLFKILRLKPQKVSPVLRYSRVRANSVVWSLKYFKKLLLFRLKNECFFLSIWGVKNNDFLTKKIELFGS